MDIRGRIGAGGLKGERKKGTMKCLHQFKFAAYGTLVVVILLYMRAVVDLRIGVKPELSWAGEQLPLAEVCEHGMSSIHLEQKKSRDEVTIRLKRELYDEVMAFQQRTSRAETLLNLLRMRSRWSITASNNTSVPRVTVILNHFKRRTLCAQLEQLRRQSLPFHRLWVLSFGSPNEAWLRRIVDRHNDPRISFVSSDHNFGYYGRFQVALQSDSDYVYILDDDMIPGTRMLEILCHVSGTDQYSNAALGSIGRILPFMWKEGSSFPSYRQWRSKEAGLYLPDPAYGIATIDRIVQVDFLCSSWFLPADLVKMIFIETPFTFVTGEDLHLSHMLQKYMDVGSFVVPVDAADKATWGDTDHRLAYVSPTTSVSAEMVRTRDEQWWRAVTSGYVTRWATMNPQNVDVLVYAHTLDEVRVLAPLLHKFHATRGPEACYLVISGGLCSPCEEAAALLGWLKVVCTERRFSILDLGVREVPVLQAVYAGMRGIIRMHNPSVVLALADINGTVKEALRMAAVNRTALVLLPKRSVSKVLWMATLNPVSLPSWNRMRISVNIITQNRPKSLLRLLTSLRNAYYLGDEVPITFNMDSRVDATTLNIINSFHWPHGPKTLRHRTIHGGVVRAVTESWYPSSDHDHGLLLEDDVQVSPYYYLWVKYNLLAYRYDPDAVPLLPEVSSISLYTPRLVEVVRERPHWNATDFFSKIHPNTPYLHQLPCSWGAVFFPEHWREFTAYVAARLTEQEDGKRSPVRVPGSRTNWWQGSWKKFLIEMMYLRGYVTLYPNFPNQTSFSTNHLEPGAHIGAKDNRRKHRKIDFEVPLVDSDFAPLLPGGKMPPASKLPVIDLFNQAASLKGLKEAGAKLRQDVIECEANAVVAVDHVTGLPTNCTLF